VAEPEPPLRFMRAVLSVEGVFLNVSDSPESQVRAMWEMRETDAYQLILADIGQVPGWLDDVHRTDMAEASTGSEAADYRDKRLTSTTSEAAETESDEASANCSHCGNPMIHAIPIAAAVELAVSANGPSHSDRLALVWITRSGQYGLVRSVPIVDPRDRYADLKRKPSPRLSAHVGDTGPLGLRGARYRTGRI
jgi:hypothetical protein